MNKEKKFIELIANVMTRSGVQLNRIYESDSEILPYKNSILLFTMDEFSQEDLLRDHDPYLLGWDLAIAGISDILASGGRPLFYAHSLVISKKWTEDFTEAFCTGVADVLKKSGISFIGGDFGKSEIWRYTVAVIGEAVGKPILRTKAAVDELIYLSGRIGSGNLEAFLKFYSDKKILGKVVRSARNCFLLRIKESLLIGKYATSCIDTSDGALNALNTLAEMSNKGYALKDLPYIKAGLLVTKLLNMSKTLLFLGECGEYELLFTIKKEDEKNFLAQAKRQRMQFFNIGKITEPGIKILEEDNKEINLKSFNIRARDFEEVKVYLNELINFLKL